MNKLLNAFIDLIKNFDTGELANYPDPAPPSDLGSPLTQDEIDFVKSLRKEMTERFLIAPGPSCTDEKTSLFITNPYYNSFTASWNNPVGYVGTQVTYRALGSVEWLIPNAAGNAIGNFNSPSEFVFTSGFTIGTTYQIRVQNTCPDGIQSSGVIVSATATNSAP